MRLRNFFDTGWYALDWDYGGAGPGRRRHQHLRLRARDDAAAARLVGALGCRGVARRRHDLPRLRRAPSRCRRHRAGRGRGRGGDRAGWCCGAGAGASSPRPCWPPSRSGPGTRCSTSRTSRSPPATPWSPWPCCCTCGTPPPRWPLRVARAGCLVAGLVLTLGTRPGMWSGLAVLLVVAVVGVVVASTTRRTALGRPRRARGVVRRRGGRARRDLPEPVRLAAAGAAPHQRGVLELPGRGEVGPALRAAAPGRGPADPAHCCSR